MDFEHLLKRFYGFCDSVILDINIQFRQKERPTVISVEIATKDREILETDQWCTVILVVEAVSEFSFQESSKASYQVISDGLSILQHNGLIFIDFGHFSDPPKEANEIRKSPVHIIGKHLSWRVEPYREFN